MNSYLALKSFTNDAIFEEVVHRIKRMHIEQFGKELRFGEVAFVFHDGKFKSIEDRSKLYLFRNSKLEGDTANQVQLPAKISANAN